MGVEKFIIFKGVPYGALGGHCVEPHIALYIGFA